MSILRPPKTFTDTQSGRASWGRSVSDSINLLIGRLAEFLPLTGGTLTNDLTVPDEAYGVGWNGSLEVPTKNALYDKIETISAGAVGDADYGDIVVLGGVWSFDTGVVTAFAKTFLDDANAGAVRTTLGLATIASSASASDLSAGTLAAARMPALTGDITTSAGAVATTLATVNANVGSFGSTTAIPVITVNAKGLVTAVTTATPAIALSGAKARKASNLTAQNVTTETAITWDSEDWDTAAYHDTGSNTDRMTPPSPGYHLVCAQLILANVVSGSWVNLHIARYNSSNVFQESIGYQGTEISAAATVRVNVSGTANFASGDFARALVQTESDTSTDIQTGSYLEIRRIA